MIEFHLALDAVASLVDYSWYPW